MRGKIQTANKVAKSAVTDVYSSFRWYLWDGGFLLFGRAEGIVPVHAHHAVQIVISVNHAALICGSDGVWQSGHGIIVKPDTEHSFDGKGISGAMLFMDPESIEGLWLRSSLTQDITVIPASRLELCIKELQSFMERPFEAMAIDQLIRHCVDCLCTGAPPLRRLDPRVTRVLHKIRASDNLRISLEEMAAEVFLSPSRFAHLFKQQLGLPFRRYILWRKLTRAMMAIGRKGSIADAAQVADFADAAHLTRTFYQMFGTPPSALMWGDFFEINPPFSLVKEYK